MRVSIIITSMRPELCICAHDQKCCAKCNKKYRAKPCTVCRGQVSIAKCSTCQVGYCSAKCKKEARKHTCELKEKCMNENQFIGGHTITDMLQPDTKTIVVNAVPVISLTNEVFAFIYGKQTSNFRMIKSGPTMHPAMSDGDVTTVCTNAIIAHAQTIVGLVGKGDGALLLECKSYIDFAHKIMKINENQPRWCTDKELVGGGPLIEGPNRDWILQSRAEGYIILRVAIMHPDRFDAAGYAQWSFNACFLVTP